MTLPLISPPAELNRLAVFTGSARGVSDLFAEAATAFARCVAAQGIDLVYGGGKVGLMGVVADQAVQAGAEVVGVIPELLVRGEVAHSGVARLEVVADMHTRKARMAELADGFVALPGGVGTLEELFEVCTWQQLGIHHKPVGVLNPAGFWDPLLTALDHMVAAGFVTPHFRESLIVADQPEELLLRMREWRPAPPKWPAPVGSA